MVTFYDRLMDDNWRFCSVGSYGVHILQYKQNNPISPKLSLSEHSQHLFQSGVKIWFHHIKLICQDRHQCT